MILAECKKRVTCEFHDGLTHNTVVCYLVSGGVSKAERQA